jgi:hypothetical protein
MRQTYDDSDIKFDDLILGVLAKIPKSVRSVGNMIGAFGLDWRSSASSGLLSYYLLRKAWHLLEYLVRGSKER